MPCQTLKSQMNFVLVLVLMAVEVVDSTKLNISNLLSCSYAGLGIIVTVSADFGFHRGK